MKRTEEGRLAVQMDRLPTAEETCVIGAGPAGLAVAARLRHQGLPVRIIERNADVASSWRAGYDSLRLHTVRRLSGLPGHPMPRSVGKWPSRDDVIRYLEDYRAHFDLDVTTDTEVRSVEAGSDGQGGRSRWIVTTASGESFPTRSLVMATGNNHTPHVPEWPGRATFSGVFQHARDYRNAGAHRGRDVLVVGAGNSGADIAVDLAKAGATVRLSVRTPPHIIRRDVKGFAAQYSGISLSRLPVHLVDRLTAWQARISLPDLTEYGLPRPSDGLYTRLLQDRTIPLQDVGIVRAVREREVVPVAAVVGFDGDHVLLAGGTTIEPDTVIAATGYRSGLEDLVGHLGVLNERGVPTSLGADTPIPGLYFVGYRYTLGGSLRDIAIEARRVAAAIGRDVQKSS